MNTYIDAAYLKFNINNKECYFAIDIRLVNWFINNHYASRNRHQQNSSDVLLHEIAIYTIAEILYKELKLSAVVHNMSIALIDIDTNNLKSSKNNEYNVDKNTEHLDSVDTVSDHQQYYYDHELANTIIPPKTTYQTKFSNHAIKEFGKHVITLYTNDRDLLQQISFLLAPQSKAIQLTNHRVRNHGQYAIELFYTNYILGNEGQVNLQPAILPVAVIKIKLILDQQLIELMLTKSMIRNFARILYGEKVKFSYNDFFTYSVIDLLVNEVRRKLPINLSFLEYSYHLLNNRDMQSQLHNFTLTSTDFQVNIFINKANVALISKILNTNPEIPRRAACKTLTNTIERPSATHVINNQTALPFKIMTASTTLSLQEINSLQAGDVVILGNSTTNFKRNQDVLIDLGSTKIGARILPKSNRLTITGFLI